MIANVRTIKTSYLLVFSNSVIDFCNQPKEPKSERVSPSLDSIKTENGESIILKNLCKFPHKNRKNNYTQNQKLEDNIQTKLGDKVFLQTPKSMQVGTKDQHSQFLQYQHE